MGSASEFVWAENAVKCEEARRRAGADATEKQVYDWYVKLAGRVIGGGLKDEPKAKKPKGKSKGK